MEQVQTKSWDEFHEYVAELRKKDFLSSLLFRGHSNSGWSLKTTLDRFTRTPVSLEDYFRALHMLKPRIDAFTRREWEFDYDEAIKWSETLPQGVVPGYDFMVYLRHNGFPSPLLDWTLSPQIASFFAFRDTAPDVESVSVYAFCEYGKGGKYRTSDAPAIHGYGPQTSGHERHFLQQAEYTICTVFKDRKQYFALHEEAVRTSDEAEKHVLELGEDTRGGGWAQDQLWKIDIPASERGRVLRTLAEYNLNAFSLFGSAESLAETLGLEYFGPV